MSPRKSRARVPPLTAAERSAINAANATKHGRYGSEIKLTSELIEALLALYHRDGQQNGHRGLDAEVCPEWQHDAAAWADYVVKEHGPRKARTQVLVRRDERLPWGPGNVKGWEYQAKPMRKKARRIAIALDPVAPLLDCLCDHRAQDTCSRSSRPCSWVIMARENAPWSSPPASEA